MASSIMDASYASSHPLGTQKNQFVQFVQNTKSPFGKITLQLNQQCAHLPAVSITPSTAAPAPQTSTAVTQLC